MGRSNGESITNINPKAAGRMESVPSERYSRF